MIALILAHFAIAPFAPALVRLLGRRVFLAMATVPLATLIWGLAHTARIKEGNPVITTVAWLPSLKFELALRMDVLQWLMLLIVSGIGVLVMTYCAWYFSEVEPSLARFSGVFVAFAGAMLGLVLSDDLLLIYVFWELTTVFSYLLIGNDPAKRSSRLAATQALVVTTLGGLAMLVGVLILGQLSGTHRASELIANPPGGAATTVAIVLILIGALSKSALIPFHFWLPGAMTAPTPVSAYLHAASMVKAGVFLVALLAPGFAGVAGWHVTILSLGVLTMLLGGWRALRQFDIKLLIAYGTVSQLGFLLVIFSIGTRSAAQAGLAMLLAHALFKATLFLVVGIIDKSTGTRDLRELSGLARQMPVLCVAAGIAGASMAGLPPMLGFVGKESVFAALLDVARTGGQGGDGTGLPTYAGWLVVLGIVLGSVLTMAYTLRFLWGAFGTKAGLEPVQAKSVPAGFAASPVLLAALTLGLGFAGPVLTRLFEPHVAQYPAGVHHAELALWHGFGLPLAFSGAVVLLGSLLFGKRVRFARLQARLSWTWSAERLYRGGMRSIDRAAVEITSLTQRGSVAAYLSFILLVVLGLPGAVMVANISGSLDVIAWDTPAQAAVGVVIVFAAIMTTRSRRRLRAVLLVGVTGYGTSMLFLLHGAPDIALTQVLVETTSLVVFVLVLRRLPDYFTDRPLSNRRYFRMALGAAVGVAVAGFMILATNARSEDPVSAAYPEPALAFGGGQNIVSVILLDIRAWDTMGEISVLVAAATGVASLIFLDTRMSGIRRVKEIPYPTSVTKIPSVPGRRVWLPGPRTLSPDRRSIIFEVVTRLMFHTMVVLSIYLLFAGHNQVGGGFAAGMVTGLALMVRYLAGGRYELDEAAPIDAGILMGTGLFVATAAALAPLAFGGSVLQSAQIDFHLGILGDPHLVTSMFFDIGVYLVVVGLLLDLLRTFGTRLDRQIVREEQDSTSTSTFAGGARL